MMQKTLFAFFSIAVAFYPVSTVYAVGYYTSMPISDIHSDWNTSSGTEHFSLVDDSGSCDEITYVYTREHVAIDEYGYDLSGIPNGSVITAIDVYPCVGAWEGGRDATSTLQITSPLLSLIGGGYAESYMAHQIIFQAGNYALQETGPYSWNYAVEKDANTTMSLAYYYIGSDPEPQTIVLSRARVVITYVP